MFIRFRARFLAKTWTFCRKKSCVSYGLYFSENEIKFYEILLEFIIKTTTMYRCTNIGKPDLGFTKNYHTMCPFMESSVAFIASEKQFPSFINRANPGVHKSATFYPENGAENAKKLDETSPSTSHEMTSTNNEMSCKKKKRRKRHRKKKNKVKSLPKMDSQCDFVENLRHRERQVSVCESEDSFVICFDDRGEDVVDQCFPVSDRVFLSDFSSIESVIPHKKVC